MDKDEAELIHEASPSLSATIERYIRTVIRLRLDAVRRRTRQEQAADAVTAARLPV